MLKAKRSHNTIYLFWKCFPDFRSSSCKFRNSLRCGVVSVFTPRQIIAKNFTNFCDVGGGYGQKRRMPVKESSILKSTNDQKVYYTDSIWEYRYMYYHIGMLEFNKLNISKDWHYNPIIRARTWPTHFIFAQCPGLLTNCYLAKLRRAPRTLRFAPALSSAGLGLTFPFSETLAGNFI